MAEVIAFPGPPTHPVLAVSVAVFRGGDVLLVKRAKPPRLWSLPGGRVEFGESLEDAALRELTEETGLSADIAGQGRVLEVLGEGTAGHYVIVNFAASYRGGTARARSDAADVAWCDIASLETYAMTPRALETIEAARAIVCAGS